MKRPSKKLKLGMYAEQLAKLYLLSKGYFIFHNIYGLGPVDIIAINEKGAVRLFDVKSVSYRSKKAKFRPGTRINRMLHWNKKD